MAISTVPNTVQVQLKQTLYGQFLENVLYFETTGEITNETLTTLGADLTDWIDNYLKDVYSFSLEFTGLTLKSMDFDQPFETDYSTGYPIAGTTTELASPVNAAALVVFKTGYIGRGRRGRVFVSGIAEDNCNANGFTSAIVDVLLDAYGNLDTSISLDGWKHVIVNRVEDGVTLDPAVAYGVTSYSCDERVHDMGRRLDN